jgi:ribosomal protein S12 methylthiotransferase
MENNMQIAILTLGCDKNTVDSEYIAGLLTKRGHCVSIPDQSGTFDALIINTCGFIDRAKEESIQAILAWAGEKTLRLEKKGGSFRLYVVGCLAERYGAELASLIPEIDGMIGVGRWGDIVRLVEKQSSPGNIPLLTSLPSKRPKVRITESMPRTRLDDFPYAYLKIADGCSHRCTFCAIPHIKGQYHSVPRKILLQEVEYLVKKGVREINLVAQDTNAYGVDLYKHYGLCELLEDITAVSGKFRVRILYFFPRKFPEKLLSLFQENNKLCPYIDIPLQHVSPSVLKRMGRPPDVSQILDTLSRYRKEIPDLSIRTTFITGFPGETRADFNRLLSLARSFRFDRLGAFTYSHEEGTPAEKLDSPVPARTAKRRLERLMLMQAEISLEQNNALIGKTCEVLIDYILPEKNLYAGRTMRDAPEVDGMVYVASPKKLKPGQFVRVRIKKASVYDLYGDKEEKHL